jgi:hypothetical protein
MSREAWGDEGLLPQSWAETAMRQDFDVARNKFNRWIVDFKSEARSPDMAAMIEVAELTLDKLAEMMEGNFE